MCIMVRGVGRGYNVVRCTLSVNESEGIIWLMIGVRFKVKNGFECRIRWMELGIICNMVRGGIIISISECAVIISGIIISVLVMWIWVIVIIIWVAFVMLLEGNKRVIARKGGDKGM